MVTVDAASRNHQIATMPPCTRCFKPRDRDSDTFVERFTDSAWCHACLRAFREALDEQTELRQDAPTLVSAV